MSFKERIQLAIRIYTPDAIGAGDSWTSNVERIIRTKREVKRGNRRLDLRPRAFFSDSIHLEDRSGPITDVHQSATIEGDAGSHTEIARKRNRFLERSYLVNDAFEPAGYKHLTIASKGDAGG